MTDIHESLKPLAVSIDSLTPDPSNARKHDKRNIEAIKASLARFGQTKPIVLHSNGTTIIAGNGTWYAAKELGWTHIAAAQTSLDTAEAVAYGIADNKTAELAEWEDDTLRDLMDALPDDLKLATGFEGDEIDGLEIDASSFPSLADEDRQPFQQMAFVLHDDQSETVRLALSKAKNKGFDQNPANDNSNGNCIYAICCEFLESSK